MNNTIHKIRKKIELPLRFMLFDTNALKLLTILVVVFELIVNTLIVNYVPYTEIDWKAYMEECEGFINGTTNYALLKGATGPLVYPAGFVYFYSALYYITSTGTNIRLAQYIFVLIYIAQIFCVFRLYTKSKKVPPYVLIITVLTSYRIHSIYALRLFNDPIAILFFYIALNLFIDQKWGLGSICFSLAVSVKMNILLFAPAILLLYLTNLNYKRVVVQLSLCAVVQLLLGAPFLFTYPIEYIKGSFDLQRIFDFKWTVNYRFLSENIFVNRQFHIALLIIHLLLLIAFIKPSLTYFKSYSRLRSLQQQIVESIKENTMKEVPEELHKIKANGKETGENNRINYESCCQLMLLPIFLCNFIGIVCSRSLHYQFYVWYFHSLPYLVWSTDFPIVSRFLLLGVIELCWNTYPSTILSSIMLHICHVALLSGIYLKMSKNQNIIRNIQRKKTM